MKIGICDDDALWCEKAKRIIEDYGEKEGIKIQFHTFLSKAQLEDFKDTLDVLFLDIELEDADGKQELGTKIALDINIRWPHCQIVFLTNYLFYATEVYESKHLYFVLKEQFRDKIEKLFSKILTIQKNSRKKLLFEEVGRNVVSLFPSQILYLERRGRITNLVTTSKEVFKIPYKMDELENEILNNDFLRCHNSYIVYMPAIQEIRKTEVVLIDHTLILISRAYVKKVKRTFMKWTNAHFL